MGIWIFSYLACARAQYCTVNRPSRQRQILLSCPQILSLLLLHKIPPSLSLSLTHTHLAFKEDKEALQSGFLTSMPTLLNSKIADRPKLDGR